MATRKFSILLTGVIVCLSTVGGQAEQQNMAEQSATTEAQGNQVIEQVGEPFDGFTLTTRYDKAIFKDGEPIKVAFRLKNLRPTMAYFVRQRDIQDFGVKVTTSDGKLVPLTEYERIACDRPESVVQSLSE